MTSIHGTNHNIVWDADIALVKPARYMGRPAAAGATRVSGSSTGQSEEMATLVEDLHRRCEGLLTGVSEC